MEARAWVRALESGGRLVTARPVRMVIKDSGRISAPEEVQFSFTVGIHEEDGAEQHPAENGGRPLTMGELGAIHEFGTGTIPARSWLRAWFDEQAPAVQSQVGAALGKMAQRQQWTGPGGLKDVARRARNTVVKRIAQHIAPELAESTLAKKAPKIVPLIDSRAFVDSISAQLQSAPGQVDTRGRRVNWDYKAAAGGVGKSK